MPIRAWCVVLAGILMALLCRYKSRRSGAFANRYNRALGEALGNEFSHPSKN